MSRRFLSVLVLTLLAMSFTIIGTAQESEIAGSIVVWMQQANQDQIEATVLDDFYAAYPNIEVSFTNYSPQEVAQQLAISIQGGAGAPDVALMQSDQLPRIVELGGLADITDFIGDDATDFVPSALRLGELDGRLYGVPWDIGPVVLYYRRDIFEAAGLPSDPETVGDLVATWDQYFEVCQTINDATALPCFANNRAQSLGDLWINLLVAQGLGWYSDDDTLTIDSPENIAALELVGTFWDAELVSDDLEWTDGWYASLNEVALQDATVPAVATLPIAAWMGGFLKNWVAPDTAGLWGVVPFPAVVEGGVRSANMGGSSYAIPAQSDNQEAAWAFIEFVNSAESQLAIFEYGDIFPARISTYADPLFSEADPYFADQPVREVYAEAALNMPVSNVNGPFYVIMKSTTETAIQNYATGRMTAAEALAEARETISLETGLE
ncbi:MAG: sugar ABC transporter substrate-binding protein [Aggregatilineales bacterium]